MNSKMNNNLKSDKITITQRKQYLKISTNT